MPGVFGTTPSARTGKPPPKAKPAPLPIPPILHAKAPPASSYTPQSHAHTYAAAPHHYSAPTPPVPSTAGHWVNVKGKWVPIYATGKGKWTQGFKTYGGKTLAHPGKPSQSAALKPAGTDAGSGYGSAAANAFKQTPAYKQALLDVFTHQSPAQQEAIVKGALKHNTPEGNAILGFVKSGGNVNFGTGDTGIKLSQGTLKSLVGTSTPFDDVGKVAKGAFNAIEGSSFGQQFNPLKGAEPQSSSGVGQTIAGAAAMGAGKLIDKIPTGIGLPAEDKALMEKGGAQLGPGQIGKNAAKDAINFYAQALPSVVEPISQAVQGHTGKALNEVVGPYKELAKNPRKFLTEHPVTGALMLAGPLHGVSRGVAGPVRAFAKEDSKLGRAVSTSRESVHVTGKLTHERGSHSKSPTVKQIQKAGEMGRYKRAPDGSLIPASRKVQMHIMTKGISDLVGVRERIRRANRQGELAQHLKSVSARLSKRIEQNIKNAPKYGSFSRAVIPGANVLRLIADGTVRRKDTIVTDLEKHLNLVSSHRGDLLGDKAKLKAHDAYVNELVKALKDKAFLKNPERAFKAAEAYQTAYVPLQANARELGHYGTMSDELLQRREIAHYAIQHMGAHLNEETGRIVDAAGHDLPNSKILAHIKGPEGMGGRMPVFTSDRIQLNPDKAARAAHYVSQERRPRPETQKNTYYAYTHGLTTPGHEALLHQRLRLRGAIDAHRTINHYIDTLAERKSDGSYWGSYKAAAKDAPEGFRPIALAQNFHPQDSLHMALENVDPMDIEEEALRYSLDLNSRMSKDTKSNQWGLIDEHALKVLQQHTNRISPDPLTRTFKALNNQFRTVALATSFKHIPGVIAENLIRDIANGVGLRSWVTGRRSAKILKQSPVGRERLIEDTGGQLAGMTEVGKTYYVSDHWHGTNLYPPLRAMEKFFKTPGPRQVRTAWHAWTEFVIAGTKHAIEEQHQTAGLGKQLLSEHGYVEAAKVDGFLGLVHRAMGLHGKILEDATKGLFDPVKNRQFRADIQRMYGKWTDLTPSAQTAMMYSPFGLWWVNSVKFLVRMPLDMPVKSGLLASTNVGTEGERRKHGLDIGYPGALPLYKQGSIPLPGGKLLQQNYYSPFGVANDPLETGLDLIAPWQRSIEQGLSGQNWLNQPLKAKGSSKQDASMGQRSQAVIYSLLGSFVPFYTKAETVATGGGQAYDVGPRDKWFPSPLPPLARKGNLKTGVMNAIRPVKVTSATSKGAASKKSSFLLGGSHAGSSGGSGGFLLGGSSNSGSGGGYLLGSK